MARHIDKIIIVRQKNGYRQGGEIKYGGQNWEDRCSQLYVDDITLDRPTQTIEVFAVDDGDDNPDFRYRVNLGTWTDSPEFVGLQPGDYNVFVENQNTGCVVNASILVIACDLTIDEFLYDEEYYDLENGWIEVAISTASENPVKVEFIYNGSSSGYVSKDGRTFRWEGLNEGNYTINIRDEWGCAVSQSVTLINVEDTEEPTAPKNLSPTDVNEGEDLRIDWDKSEDEQTWVTHYRIYRSTSQGFTPGAGNLYEDNVNGGLTVGSTDEEWQDPYHIDTGVTHGITYYYRITAFDARGNESAPSDELAVTFTDDVEPSPPTNLTTTSGNTEADIAWDPSSTGDVQEYNLYRSEDGGSTWTKVVTQAGTSYTDTALTNGTQHHYYATAVDEAGNESIASNMESVIPADVTAPAIPSISASVTEDVEEVDLSITLSDTDDLQGYRIYRAYKKDDGTTSVYSQVKQINTTQGSANWTDTDVEWDVTYYYKMTSIDEVPNESAQSPKATATPFPDRTPPATPSISGKQKFFGEKEVELTVTIPDTTDLQGYNIYRAPSSGGPYTLKKQIQTQNASATWVDDTTTLSTEYFYVATSFDEGPNIDGAEPNESSYSTEISVTPEPVPQDQSVKIDLAANTVSEDPGFLGFDLGGLADTIFWDYVLDNGDDIRIRRPDGDSLPMVLFKWDRDKSQGFVIFADDEFDPTQDHTYFIWFDDPDNTGRDGTPAGRQTFADTFYQKIPNVQFLMLPGEHENRVQSQSGVTLKYIYDHLPEPWQKATFSGTQNKGTVTHNGGQSYTFEAYGNYIWDQGSHGEYLFKPIVGDCKITTKVILQDDTEQWAKFGPYITSDVYERAPLASTLITPNDGIFGDVRKQYNGNNTHDGGEDRNSDLSPQTTSEDPVWLRLERTNGEIIFSYSIDGTNYTELGRVGDFLPERIAAGFAATSHNSSTACTVEAREVSVQGTTGDFMFGDDQILALDGISFDPALSDTIEQMHTSVLIEPRVFSNSDDGYLLSFDHNEYFHLTAPDRYNNRYGFDSHHNGSQRNDENMNDYDFDEVSEAFLQYMFWNGDPNNYYDKEKWMNGDRDGQDNPGDPMIGSNKRFGLIGANSESAAFMDENWSDRGPHHIFYWFMWALTGYTGAQRYAEERFLFSPKSLWEYPIVYILQDAETADGNFVKLIGESMDGSALQLESPASPSPLKLIGEPMDGSSLLVRGSASLQLVPPEPGNEAGLSGQLQAQIDITAPNLDAVSSVDVYRSTTKGGSYTKIGNVPMASLTESYTDTGLNPYETYYYALRAVESDGDESLQYSDEKGVQTGSGTAINLQSIVIDNPDPGNELTISATSPNGGVEYSLDGGTYQTSNTFSNISTGTHTVDIRDANSETTSYTFDFTGFEDFTFDNGIVGDDVASRGDHWTVPSGATKGWKLSDDADGVTEGFLCMEAKDIGDSQTAEVVLTVDLTATGNLTFDWAVSSESCCDRLEVYVDGSSILNEGGVLSGSKSHALTTGVHEIRFAYTKDGSVSSNKDTAWIDNIQLPANDVTASGTLFSNAAPQAPSGRYEDHTSSSITIVFDTKDLDIETLEVYKKAEADQSYSLLDTFNYPLLPREYVDNNYDESLGHTYRGKVIDVAGQVSPFSNVVKPALIEDFEGDLSGWTINDSDFTIRTDRVYEGSQAAGMDDYVSSEFAAERVIPTDFSQPSTAEWYWNEDSSQYGSATHFYNSNGNLELALGTQNPQWQAWDGTGMDDEIYAGDGYDRWIYYKVTFDWSNSTYDYYMEDMQSGHVETGTRSLRYGVDVNKIGLGERVNSSSRIHTWWDNIQIG